MGFRMWFCTEYLVTSACWSVLEDMDVPKTLVGYKHCQLLQQGSRSHQTRLEATLRWRAGIDTENSKPLPVGFGSPAGRPSAVSGPAGAAAHSLLANFIAEVCSYRNADFHNEVMTGLM